jgi:endonuclease/exonuclease/phosphatase family metal-dependent hydrolase
VEAAAGEATERDAMTAATMNVWFDRYHAAQRWSAIADLLGALTPDFIALQEITEAALDTFLAQEWVRNDYLSAAVVGERVGNYGLLVLSRLPLASVTHVQLPSRQWRGFLKAELSLDGDPSMCCLHLDSGKSSAYLRAWQLRRIFRVLRKAEDAVLLGDFNMRDAEDGRISARYRDVWPLLRPGEPGYTEDTSINLMRLDAKNKKRQVRFDRVLVKGERWQATDIELFGTQPISDHLPRVFPSDHFGVWCRLQRR